MADNDILFDGAERKTVKEIMTRRGYDVKSYNNDNDDVYVKPPVYNFEMHASLFADELGDSVREYFESAFDRAVKIPQTSFGYRMTDEDFYIYQKAHEYKHYVGGGTGIRSIIDTYVMLSAFGDKLDSEYVKEELVKLGILDYERRVRRLSEKLLSPAFAANPPRSLSDILDEPEMEMLKYLVTSGTYGTSSRVLENRLERNIESEGSESRAKRKMIREKFFPPMSYYKAHHPTLYKYKILILLFISWRLIRNLFTRPVAAFKELMRILKTKSKKK